MKKEQGTPFEFVIGAHMGKVQAAPRNIVLTHPIIKKNISHLYSRAAWPW